MLYGYKQCLDDCSVILAECEAMRQVIIIALKMNIPRVCTRSDSQAIINIINEKIGVS